MKKISENPTASRIAYLAAVKDHGIYLPRHGIAANHCAKLGWVEDVCMCEDGAVRPYSEARGEGMRPVEFMGMRLTDTGLAILIREAPAPDGSGA